MEARFIVEVDSDTVTIRLAHKGPVPRSASAPAWTDQTLGAARTIAKGLDFTHARTLPEVGGYDPLRATRREPAPLVEL